MKRFLTLFCCITVLLLFNVLSAHAESSEHIENVFEGVPPLFYETHNYSPDRSNRGGPSDPTGYRPLWQDLDHTVYRYTSSGYSSYFATTMHNGKRYLWLIRQNNEYPEEITQNVWNSVFAGYPIVDIGRAEINNTNKYIVMLPTQWNQGGKLLHLDNLVFVERSTTTIAIHEHSNFKFTNCTFTFIELLKLNHFDFQDCTFSRVMMSVHDIDNCYFTDCYKIVLSDSTVRNSIIEDSDITVRHEGTGRYGKLRFIDVALTKGSMIYDADLNKLTITKSSVTACGHTVINPCYYVFSGGILSHSPEVNDSTGRLLVASYSEGAWSLNNDIKTWVGNAHPYYLLVNTEDTPRNNPSGGNYTDNFVWHEYDTDADIPQSMRKDSKFYHATIPTEGYKTINYRPHSYSNPDIYKALLGAKSDEWENALVPKQDATDGVNPDPQFYSNVRYEWNGKMYTDLKLLRKAYDFSKDHIIYVRADVKQAKVTYYLYKGGPKFAEKDVPSDVYHVNFNDAGYNIEATREGYQFDHWVDAETGKTATMAKPGQTVYGVWNDLKYELYLSGYGSGYRYIYAYTSNLPKNIYDLGGHNLTLRNGEVFQGKWRDKQTGKEYTELKPGMPQVLYLEPVVQKGTYTIKYDLGTGRIDTVKVNCGEPINLHGSNGVSLKTNEELTGWTVATTGKTYRLSEHPMDLAPVNSTVTLKPHKATAMGEISIGYPSVHTDGELDTTYTDASLIDPYYCPGIKVFFRSKDKEGKPCSGAVSTTKTQVIALPYDEYLHYVTVAYPGTVTVNTGRKTVSKTFTLPSDIEARFSWKGYTLKDVEYLYGNPSKPGDWDYANYDRRVVYVYSKKYTSPAYFGRFFSENHWPIKYIEFRSPYKVLGDYIYDKVLPEFFIKTDAFTTPTIDKYKGSEFETREYYGFSNTWKIHTEPHEIVLDGPPNAPKTIIPFEDMDFNYTQFAYIPDVVYGTVNTNNHWLFARPFDFYSKPSTTGVKNGGGETAWIPTDVRTTAYYNTAKDKTNPATLAMKYYKIFTFQTDKNAFNDFETNRNFIAQSSYASINVPYKQHYSLIIMDAYGRLQQKLISTYRLDYPTLNPKSNMGGTLQVGVHALPKYTITQWLPDRTPRGHTSSSWGHAAQASVMSFDRYNAYYKTVAFGDTGSSTIHYIVPEIEESEWIEDGNPGRKNVAVFNYAAGATSYLYADDAQITPGYTDTHNTPESTVTNTLEGKAHRWFHDGTIRRVKDCTGTTKYNFGKVSHYQTTNVIAYSDEFGVDTAFQVSNTYVNASEDYKLDADTIINAYQRGYTPD